MAASMSIHLSATLRMWCETPMMCTGDVNIDADCGRACAGGGFQAGGAPLLHQI
jgi:hypothetical protein